MDKKQMLEILKSEDSEKCSDLFNKAYQAKTRYVGNKVYLRGIIELSNICLKDCYYCGIRKSNNSVKRFSMSHDEILSSALLAANRGYGSILLQAGERTDDEFTFFIERLLTDIKNKTDNRLGITLSLGEQSGPVLEKWFKAGAHRYLLRIETSNKNLYGKIHPPDHDFNKRLETLKILKNTGYQVGTGVMIGLPGQTYEDLANDIIFFRKIDIDMIGMGPYIVHANTPLKDLKNYDVKKHFILGLKMIALARLYLKDINIASTTALQTLDSAGYKAGIKAGANVLMPNITPLKYMNLYKLYENKPGKRENSRNFLSSFKKEIKKMGEELIYDEWGDSPHYFLRKNSDGSSRRSITRN
jgi:biotin synthase